MTFLEMLKRAYWALDDSYEVHANIEVDDMKGIVNEGLQDLAPDLNYIVSETLSLTSKAASLPEDFLEPVRLEWGINEDDEIPQVYDLDEKGRYYECFFIGDESTLTIFTDAGVADGTEVKLWYKARPEVLTEDADTPSVLPARFHHYIPDIYVKAVYALRNNELNSYNGLMVLWEDVKTQVRKATQTGRNRAASFSKKLVW